MKKLTDSGVAAWGGSLQNAAISSIWNNPNFDQTPFIKMSQDQANDVAE
jgi:hypothetical protein